MEVLNGLQLQSLLEILVSVIAMKLLTEASALQCD